jgi:hypothetical protein
MNNRLQKKYETVMGTEVKLRKELKGVKVANDKLKKYWVSKVKDCEKEEKILVIQNQELQKELEAIKMNVAVQNLQLVGCTSQKQQGRQRGIDNFQIIRRLGEGAFGTVHLATGKLPGGPELYTIKTLKK